MEDVSFAEDEITETQGWKCGQLVILFSLLILTSLAYLSYILWSCAVGADAPASDAKTGKMSYDKMPYDPIRDKDNPK